MSKLLICLVTMLLLFGCGSGGGDSQVPLSQTPPSQSDEPNPSVVLQENNLDIVNFGEATFE